MKNFISKLKMSLGLRPKYPSDFVAKFISMSKRKRTQLQLIHKNRILLHVDPLKFVPSWFNFTSDSFKKKYFEGYVVFFIIDKKGIEKNIEYIKYKKNTDFKMIEIEEKHGETEVITFAQFFERKIDHISLTLFFKKVIDNIYMSKEQNLEILFQIENLENIPG